MGMHAHAHFWKMKKFGLGRPCERNNHGELIGQSVNIECQLLSNKLLYCIPASKSRGPHNAAHKIESLAAWPSIQMFKESSACISRMLMIRVHFK